MLLLSISSLLEEYTHARTKAVLTSSLAIKADKVWLVNENEDVLIPMSELKTGDRIRIRTGSVIPVDGEVTDGEAYVKKYHQSDSGIQLISLNKKYAPIQVTSGSTLKTFGKVVG